MHFSECLEIYDLGNENNDQTPAEDSPQMVVVKSKGILPQNGRRNHSG